MLSLLFVALPLVSAFGPGSKVLPKSARARSTSLKMAVDEFVRLSFNFTHFF